MKRIIILLVVVLSAAGLCIPISAKAPTDYIAYFSFDNEEVGLSGGDAKASVIGSGASFSGGVLTLKDGKTYIKVTRSNGSPLLTGYEAITISFKVKIEGSPTWAFYVAPTTLPSGTNFQNYLMEKYIGCLLDTTFNVERYNNEGKTARPSSSVGSVVRGSWTMVTAVFDKTETRVYVDGNLSSTTPNTDGFDLSLTSILGDDSIFYIGRANWGSGEYFYGSLDDFVVYGYALTSNQVLDLARSGVPGSVDGDDSYEPGDNGSDNGSSDNDSAPQTGFNTVILAVGAVISCLYIVKKVKCSNNRFIKAKTSK